MKKLTEQLTKIDGIGPKTAKKAASLDAQSIQELKDPRYMTQLYKNIGSSKCRAILDEILDERTPSSRNLETWLEDRVNERGLEYIDGINCAVAERIRVETDIETVRDLDDPVVLGALPDIRGIGSKRMERIIKHLTDLGAKKFRTESWLKEKRHWTDAGIRDFLGSPDRRKKNPHYSTGAKMKLYDMERVRRTEATPKFQEWLAGSLKRQKSARKAAKKAAEVRRRNTLRWARNVSIRLDTSSESYRNHAIKNFNRRCGPLERKATQDSDDDFLQRITVNEIRHNWVRVSGRSYEQALGKIEGKVGKRRAYYTLKKRVLQKIKNERPHLSDECDRQIDRLKNPHRTPACSESARG
jgi:ribosomal protein S13